MNTKIRFAIAAAVLAAGAAAAPAFADSALPSTGNGDAVLYVRNVTTDATYVRGLGQSMDSLLTTSQIAASGSQTAVVQESNGVTTVLHDPGLAAFLGSNPDPNNFQWAVLGGDSVKASTTGVKNSGEERYITTTQSTINVPPNISNSQLNTVFNNLNSTQTTGNAAINTGVEDTSSGVGQAIYSPNALPDPTQWYGAGLNNVSNLGQTANLYMLATNGGASGTGGLSTTKAFVFQFVNLTLTTAGDLIGVASVPIPAAIWLLGSGLLGLAGIRRRTVAAA
jgi:hypothetical protein